MLAPHPHALLGHVVPDLVLTRSHRYSDDEYEYRHVLLPKQMLKLIPDQYLDQSKKTLKLLWEDEWRSMGITQVLCLRRLWACYGTLC